MICGWCITTKKTPRERQQPQRGGTQTRAAGPQNRKSKTMNSNTPSEVNRDIIKEAREFLRLAQIGDGAAERCQRDPICLFQEVEEGETDYRTTRAFLSVREASAYRKLFAEEHPSVSTRLYVVSLHASRDAQGSRFREIVQELLSLFDPPNADLPSGFVDNDLDGDHACEDLKGFSHHNDDSCDDEGRPFEPPPVSPSSGDILCGGRER